MLWAVDYYLYATNPVGYHVTNGLLLTLSAALVYILAVLMLRHRFAAMIAALLYGLHPLHVQATVWIAGRPSLLVTVFFVLAVIGYVFGQSRPRMRWLSWLAAALALMSKESATTLPAVIALTYVVCRPLPVRAHTAMRHDAMNQTEPTAALARLSWRSWAFGLLRDVAPYLGIVIAYLMFRVVVIGELRPYYQGSYTDWPVVSNNLATAIKMLGIPWTQPDPATPFVTRQAWGWVLAFAGLLMLTLACRAPRVLGNGLVPGHLWSAGQCSICAGEVFRFASGRGGNRRRRSPVTPGPDRCRSRPVRTDYHGCVMCVGCCQYRHPVSAVRSNSHDRFYRRGVG
ncbi:MAG: hypothetical protein HZY76_14210 [Anaerolineae bacterium]|nr:MAG: hypothetical protein HZY76_14210 [Anaerolineae bacterium]